MPRRTRPRSGPIPITPLLLALLAAGCEDPDLEPGGALAQGEHDEQGEHGDLDGLDDADDDAADADDDAAADPPVADGVDDLADRADEPSAIYGGADVERCGWASTVEIGGACTGTLVHPEVVIYAAHCGASYNKIYLGESIAAPARVVAPEWCRIYPGGGPGEGDDFAVCKLAEPVTDVPIVPILMGCEAASLNKGDEVTLVGFGNADSGPYGVKRQVKARINGYRGSEIFIGGGGKDTCQGDSGGPVYTQLADGTWRVFGVTSYGGACGTGGYYSMMHKGMPWFEEETGLDLTPCHDADGTWNPGPACGNFLLDPAVGGDAWTDGCAAGPRSRAYSATCGAPFADVEPMPEPEPEPSPRPVCDGCDRLTSARPRSAGDLPPEPAEE